MNFRLAIFVVIVPIIFGCNKEKEEDAYTGPVLAKVNDSVLTPDDFLISLELLYQPSERPMYTTPEGKRKFLQLLTVMELFYQEGKRQGLDEDPYIKNAVENYRRHLIYHTLITQNINSESMKQYFQENFFHVALIRNSKPDGADQETIAKIRGNIEKILEKLNAGEEFEKIARKYSDHPSKENGGDPGPITFTKEWPIEVLRTAATLSEVGQISPLVDAPDAYYILKLLEPYGQLNFSGLTDNLQLLIYNSLVQNNFKNSATQLQLMADIKMYPENLDLLRTRALAEKDEISIPTLPSKGIPSIEGGAD